MEKYIDLHTHSIYSDGELSPLELVKLASNNDVGVLSITDHNTVDAYKNFDYKKIELVRVIPGIELSADVSKGQMHILGLGINPTTEEINEVVKRYKLISIDSVSAIVRQLKIDYDINIPSSLLKDLFASSHSIGRPDIARILVKLGLASDVSDAFKKYLVDAYYKTMEYRKLLSYKECIEVIKSSAGIPVLAHPKSLKLTQKELCILLKDMINVGLKGIEVYHSSHEQFECEYYNYLASQLGLLISGGSDYHGVNTKPDIELGSGKNNNLRLKKLSILNYL